MLAKAMLAGYVGNVMLVKTCWQRLGSVDVTHIHIYDGGLTPVLESAEGRQSRSYGPAHKGLEGPHLVFSCYKVQTQRPWKGKGVSNETWVFQLENSSSCPNHVGFAT